MAILTDDPDNKLLQVPVTLVVTDFRQGVNAGGGRYVNTNGNVSAADRSYGSGPYGYVHRGSTRSTAHSIAGTTEDGRYKNLREDMTEYKFTVPRTASTRSISASRSSSSRTSEIASST